MCEVQPLVDTLYQRYLALQEILPFPLRLQQQHLQFQPGWHAITLRDKTNYSAGAAASKDIPKHCPRRHTAAASILLAQALSPSHDMPMQ